MSSYFCGVKKIPAGNFFTFDGIKDFERQIDKIRNIIHTKGLTNVNIVISVHSRPGGLFFGYQPNGAPILVGRGDPSDLQRLIAALTGVYNDTLPSRSGWLFLEGCNTMGFLPSYTSNTQQDLANQLFSALDQALGIPLYGEMGFSSIYGQNFDLQSGGGGVFRYPVP